MENLYLKHELISRTYYKKSLIMASTFGSKSKFFMTMSIPSQDEPLTSSAGSLSQFMHKPLRSHLRVALRVLRYLKGNPGKGVHIVKQSKASLEAFVDADWAKCLITRKFVTGFCIKLNGSLISWKSKK
ncbi:hypothetical protein Tco_1295863 [Tanacetum coccineum]